jgi:hypothetical protein
MRTLPIADCRLVIHKSFKSVAAIPLTPALSRRERENCSLPFEKIQAVAIFKRSKIKEKCQSLFPLPLGEGQGEGNFIYLSRGNHNRQSAI